MSLSTGQRASWDDIKSLYDNLNTTHAESNKYGRKDFGYPNTTPITAGTGNKIIVNQQSTKIKDFSIQSLNAFIAELSGNRFLSSITVGVTLPTVGTKITPIEVSTLKNQVDKMNGTCPYDASCYGYVPPTFSSCNGYTPPTFSSCNGYTPPTFSGNNGWTPSFSGNHGYVCGCNNSYFAANRSWSCSGCNASYFAANMSR